MRIEKLIPMVAVAILITAAGCASRSAYSISWTIEEAHPGSPRRQIAANESKELPNGWTATGRDVRVLEEAPATPHDTLGFLYWRHTEVPLTMKVEGTQCEAVSKPGSVTTSRVCDSAIYSVEAQCEGRCRRDILSIVADSLGATAIIVAEERLKFEGLDGEPAEVPQTYAQNEGFRGTYVMIKQN